MSGYKYIVFYGERANLWILHRHKPRQECVPYQIHIPSYNLAYVPIFIVFYDRVVELYEWYESYIELFLHFREANGTLNGFSGSDRLSRRTSGETGAQNGTGPEIRHGKSCYDLPSHSLAYLRPRVVAAHTGPNGGLCTVSPNAPNDANGADSKSTKTPTSPFLPDLDATIDFIDDSPLKPNQGT